MIEWTVEPDLGGGRVVALAEQIAAALERPILYQEPRAQGYYLSPPLAPADFIAWLEGALPLRGLAAAPVTSRQEPARREAAG